MDKKIVSVMANVVSLEKMMTNIQSEVSSLKVRADSAETNTELEDLKTQSAFLCHYHRENGLQEDIVFKIRLFIVVTRLSVNRTTFFVKGEASTWSRVGCGLLHFLHVLFFVQFFER